MNDISLDEIQGYVTSGLTLHPLLLTIYYNKLMELSNKSKCSLLPYTRLNIYYHKHAA